YVFSVASDDGSRLFIDNKLAVINDGSKTAFALNSAPITLSLGLHEFRLDYVQGGGSDELNLNYSGTDTANNMVLVPASAMQTLDTISQNNNISVTTNSTINLPGNNFTQVGMGNLSFNVAPGGSATLNINGDPGRSLHLSGITLPSAATDTINTTTTVFAGQLSSLANSTLVKTGTGTLIFDNTATPNNFGSGSTIDIQQGTAEVITGFTSSTGTNSPTGSGLLQIDGGTLEFDGKVNQVSELSKITVTGAGGMLESAQTLPVFLSGSIQLNGNLKVATASGNSTSFPSSIHAVGIISGSGNI